MSKRARPSSIVTREPVKKRARIEPTGAPTFKPHLYVVVSDDGVYTNTYTFTCADTQRRQKMLDCLTAFFDAVKTEYAPGYTDRVSKSVDYLFGWLIGLGGTCVVPPALDTEISRHFKGAMYWRKGEWDIKQSNNTSFWHHEAESVSVFVCK